MKYLFVLLAVLVLGSSMKQRAVAATPSSEPDLHAIADDVLDNIDGALELVKVRDDSYADRSVPAQTSYVPQRSTMQSGDSLPIYQFEN